MSPELVQLEVPQLSVSNQTWGVGGGVITNARLSHASVSMLAAMIVSSAPASSLLNTDLVNQLGNERVSCVPTKHWRLNRFCWTQAITMSTAFCCDGGSKSH